MAENAAGKQRGKPFPKGVSGNPGGKRPGTRHRATRLAEQLMAEDAEEIVQAIIDAAKGGDMTAARLVLDRIAPARRDNPVTFKLPPIANAEDAAKAMGALLGAVAAGELTPSEADQVAKIIETFVRALEAAELEARLAALERRTQQ